MGKLSLMIGMGAGYVLGTRAGREKYEEIAGRARAMWQSPAVQERAGKVQAAAKERLPGGSGRSGEAGSGEDTQGLDRQRFGAQDGVSDSSAGLVGSPESAQPLGSGGLVEPGASEQETTAYGDSQWREDPRG